MGIPIVYRKSAEQKLINFDFVDSATGTGYVVFYAGMTGKGTFVLSQNPFYSSKPCSGSTTAVTMEQTINFDLDVEKPFRVEGVAVIEVPMTCAPGGSFNYNMNARTTIQKIDASSNVTTLSAEVSGAVIRQAGSASQFSDTTSTEMNIPRTLFKPGEKLRLVVTEYGWCDTSNSGNWSLGFDPQGRTTVGKIAPLNGDEIAFQSGDNTILKISLPIKVDI